MSADLYGVLAEFASAERLLEVTRKAREAGKEHMLTAFAADLAAMWGDPGTRRLVAWPLNMRLGQL